MCDPIEPPDERVEEYAEWIECAFTGEYGYNLNDVMSEVLETNIVHSRQLPATTRGGAWT